MPGLSGLMDIGRKALFAAQTNIQVTGNNIANVNTEGYSRRYVRLEESTPIDFRPGQLGTGVEAVEVLRRFDRFVEETYLDKSSMQHRYDALLSNLKGLESLFNEANSKGVSEALSAFFNDWDNLSQRPEDYATREQLFTNAGNLVSMLQQTEEQLSRFQQQTDRFITNDVNEVNRILGEITAINEQIRQAEIPGQNIPNGLYDQRNQLVRSLAEKMDIRTIDNGGGDLTVLTKAGHTLVDGVESYEIRFERSSRSIPNLTQGSSFDGQLNVTGSDDFEYLVDVVVAGDVNDADPANWPQARISMDGGRTWVQNPDGSEMRLTLGGPSSPVEFGGLKLSLDNTAGHGVEVGDQFSVVPKSGIYWYQDTATSENITPQVFPGGEENGRRLTGGSLAGLFDFRDNHAGRYRDQLDSFVRELVWQVNSVHSQGAGLTHMTDTVGGFSVLDASQALNSNTAGLEYRDKLQSGSMSLYFYDPDGNLLGGQGVVVDFDSATAGQQNFDPASHSLNDVRQAIEDSVAATTGLTPGTDFDVQIVDGTLRVSTSGGNTFGFGQDSTGLAAALGLNSFFSGSTANDIEISSQIATDRSRINAGHINGDGEANQGDNLTAKAIAGLEDKDVEINTRSGGTFVQALPEFFSSLVTTVGADTASADFSHQYQQALAQDLDARQQSVAGVNLDEEMSNLMRFQHSYTAAAKLISVADEMYQTLLGMHR